FGNMELFATSFERDLSRYELDTISHISTGHPTSAQVSMERDAISVEKTLYGYEVRYGSPKVFQFEHPEHAECLATALRLQHRKGVPLKQALAWRLPVKPEGCRKLLDLLNGARAESRRLSAQIASGEDELNEVVYRLYDVPPAERRVIENFLGRYSSQPAELDQGGSEVEEGGSAPPG
ncbi:MAG: hypothetical protein ACRD22_07755, partial [Terriglobia bacterium]